MHGHTTYYFQVHTPFECGGKFGGVPLTGGSISNEHMWPKWVAGPPTNPKRPWVKIISNQHENTILQLTSDQRENKAPP